MGGRVKSDVQAPPQVSVWMLSRGLKQQQQVGESWPLHCMLLVNTRAVWPALPLKDTETVKPMAFLVM